MFPFIARKILLTSSKKYIHPFDISKRYMKVCVLGAAGGIGTNLCLLLKQSPLVTHLNMYDIVPHLPGVAMDLSHIESNCHVCAFCGKQCLPEALTGMQILVFTCGFFRDTSMVRDDLFDKNAEIIVDICEVAAVKCPNAIIMIVTNPVNSLVPLVAEFMKKNQVYNPKKLIGVTSYNVRANTLIAEMTNCCPSVVNCPIIGGQDAHTVVPVLSQCVPKISATDLQLTQLTEKIKGTNEKQNESEETETSPLTTAYTAARMVTGFAQAMLGNQGIIEFVYCESLWNPHCLFFASPVILGRYGIQKSLGLPLLSPTELNIINEIIPKLNINITRGLNYAKHIL